MPPNETETLLTSLRDKLLTREREEMHISGFRSAAVLVPLLKGEGGLELLFTVRSHGLSNHAGQIAFPGGRLDAGETLEGAAARETLEETGLAVEPSGLLGRLDDHPSPAGYIVTPVVGVLAWPQPLTLNPAEVAEAFCVPLANLRTLTPRSEERRLEHYRRLLHFYTWEERLIWGVTGNILKNLLDVLKQ